MRKNKMSKLAHVRFRVFTVMNMQFGVFLQKKKKKRVQITGWGRGKMDYLASIM